MVTQESARAGRSPGVLQPLAAEQNDAWWECEALHRTVEIWGILMNRLAPCRSVPHAGVARCSYPALLNCLSYLQKLQRWVAVPVTWRAAAQRLAQQRAQVAGGPRWQAGRRPELAGRSE